MRIVSFYEDILPALSEFARLWPKAKIVFMSGYTDDAVVRHGILTPGIAYLQKPFTGDTLAGKVRAALDG